MAASPQEFHELIGNDVGVDIPLLRRLAFYGIPPEVRGSIWNLLLPTLVSTPMYTESELHEYGTLKGGKDLYDDDSLADTEILRVSSQLIA